ncbi:MAG: ankyrin repeat domain-containing protein [Micavibrio sp.]|nr:ankyrin repeat domain-containing protein [Micavibrio sp.]
MGSTVLDNNLLNAAKKGDLDTVSDCAAEGAKATAQDVNGRCGLYYAAQAGDLDMIRLLLVHKGDVDAADDDGFTPLKAAIEAKQFGAAGLLLEQQANINKQDGNALFTALHAAVNSDMREKDGSRITFLLEQGADFNSVRNLSGQTPYEMAKDHLTRLPDAQFAINAFDAFLEGAENHARRLQREAEAERSAAVFGGLTRPIAAKVIRFKNPAA